MSQRLRASAAAAACSTQTSTVYASLADFVEEAAAVGRIRYRRWETVTSGNCTASSASDTHTYDSAKRLLTSRYEGPFFNISATVMAWDALGRPIQEMSDSTDCQGTVATSTYDDVARTVTYRVMFAGAGPRCGTEGGGGSSTYDADGNLLHQRTVNDAGVTTSYSNTNTIASTENVCL